MHGAQMVAINMQVNMYMGDGWHLNLKQTLFDIPPHTSRPYTLEDLGVVLYFFLGDPAFE